MGIKYIISKEEFEDILQSNQDRLTVVNFTATWCGPCKKIAPVVETLAKANSGVAFYKVDINELSELSGEMKVQSVPTFIYYNDNIEVGRVVGADVDKLVNGIRQLS